MKHRETIEDDSDKEQIQEGSNNNPPAIKKALWLSL